MRIIKENEGNIYLDLAKRIQLDDLFEIQELVDSKVMQDLIKLDEEESELAEKPIQEFIMENQDKLQSQKK